MVYEFDVEKVAQHVIKYGVDLRPLMAPGQDVPQMREYGDWLVRQFPQHFESVVSGRGQLRVQRSFITPNRARVEMTMFTLTNRGPVFSFPQRLYIGQPFKFGNGDSDTIFRHAIDELRRRFPKHMVPRVGVVHEFIFETGETNPVEVLTEGFGRDRWRSVRSLRLVMQVPDVQHNISIGMWPTQMRSSGQGQAAAPGQELRFGIAVHVDINNLVTPADMNEEQLDELLAFTGAYVPDQLLAFLNDQP